jgi:RHS repeat-associated protein
VPNRHASTDSYRYGFNGKEKDDELKGEGNSYNFGARMLDPRVGRWFASDPHESKYPSLSGYSFVGNMPLQATDPDGKDIIFVNGYRALKTGDASDRDPSFQKKLKDTYWNNVNKGFTKEVERYFRDGTSHFVTGDHKHGSEAWQRQEEGYDVGVKMVNSNEIKVSAENNIMTIVMHSQGNAEGVGIALGIIDAAKAKGITVKVNLVFLSVHQPDDIMLLGGLAKRGIQFTYANDNAGILQPMAKQKGSEGGLDGVIDANSANKKWKKDGLAAHSATVDDNEAFDAIKKTDQKEKIYVAKPKKK